MFGGDGFDLFRIPNFFDAVRNRCPLNNWHGAGSLKHDRYRTVLERVWPRTEERERGRALPITLQQIQYFYLIFILIPFCCIFNSRMAFYHLIYGRELPIFDMKYFTSGKWFYFSLIYLPLQSSLCLLPSTPGAFLFPTVFYFLRVLAPFLVHLRRPLRRHSGTGESLKQVLWWAPFALAQLPVPSVNWSFKPDTPRRHCDRSTSFLSVASYMYTRLFLFFSSSFLKIYSFGVRTVNKCMQSLSHSTHSSDFSIFLLSQSS